MTLVMPTKDVRTVPDFKSEYMGNCVFCNANRKPDPNLVIVSLDSQRPDGSPAPAICETCMTGACCAAAREFRRLSERYKKPPQKPRPKKKS